MGTTATAVSRALSAGGETRSVFHRSGMVRGYGTSSRGFQAKNVPDRKLVEDWGWDSRGKDRRWVKRQRYVNVPSGEVTVEWCAGSSSFGDHSADRDHRLASYVEILSAEGFKAEIKTDPLNPTRPYVHVTKD